MPIHFNERVNLPLTTKFVKKMRICIMHTSMSSSQKISIVRVYWLGSGAEPRKLEIGCSYYVNIHKQPPGRDVFSVHIWSVVYTFAETSCVKEVDTIVHIILFLCTSRFIFPDCCKKCEYVVHHAYRRHHDTISYYNYTWVCVYVLV